MGSEQLWLSWGWWISISWTGKRWSLWSNLYKKWYSWRWYKLRFTGVLFHVRNNCFLYTGLEFMIPLFSCCPFDFLCLRPLCLLNLMTSLITSFDASKNGTLVGKVPKDIRGHLFPTVAVHSQNEEYVLTFSLMVNTNAIMYLLCWLLAFWVQ